uniref:Perilipin n=1 Tax=Pelusios castaneus TaxID=367368 RepID=A0A8C8VJ17_9SAUR
MPLLDWLSPAICHVLDSPYVEAEPKLANCRTQEELEGAEDRRSGASNFTMASEKKATKAEEEQEANVVNRVASLPLISSAYNLVSSAYSYTKGTHPYVSNVCSVAETVAAVAVGSAVGGAQPILSHLEPQIASVNEYACKELDKLEKRLPFLQQPTEKVISDTKQMISTTVMTAVEAAKGAVASRVAGAVDVTKDVVQESVERTKSAVSSTVASAVDAAFSAKDMVTNSVADAVDLTRGAVQDSVQLTKSVVSSTVNTAKEAACGAKDVVTSKVNTAVGRSREAIQDGVEMTSFVVTNSIYKAKAAGQMVASGVDAVLEKSEELVDHYLPMTDEELAKLATAVKGFNTASVEEQKQRQNYFVRLGSLSNKVRHRAYQHSLNKLRLVKENTQDTLSHLQLAINLIEYAKQGVGQKLQDSLEKLQQLWMEWSRSQPTGIPAKDASHPEVESRTLAMVRIITHQLHPVYVNLVSSIQGLPNSIQETVQQVVTNIQQLHSSFSRADSFQDLSSSCLTQSQETVTKAQESLDILLEYVAHNTPLNWLVGPFTPSVRVTPGGTKEPKEIMMTEMKSSAPKEVPTAQQKLAKVAKALEKEATMTLKEETQVPNAPKEETKALKTVEEGDKAAEQVTKAAEKMVVQEPKEDP